MKGKKNITETGVQVGPPFIVTAIQSKTRKGNYYGLVTYKDTDSPKLLTKSFDIINVPRTGLVIGDPVKVCLLPGKKLDFIKSFTKSDYDDIFVKNEFYGFTEVSTYETLRIVHHNGIITVSYGDALIASYEGKKLQNLLNTGRGMMFTNETFRNIIPGLSNRFHNLLLKKIQEIAIENKYHVSFKRTTSTY